MNIPFAKADKGLRMDSEISHDFDFEFGDWLIHHRRLKHRLAGSTEWEAFEGTCTAARILGGNGIVEDQVLQLPGGTYRAATLRSYDVESRTWAIWWLDARHPHRLDVPVVGSFSDGVGTFFADDTFEGRPIKVRFLWLETNTATPLWEQAFSPDGGATWETNWEMVFKRA